LSKLNKRKIQSWLSEIAFKRLCLAILLSLLIHLFLIGKFAFFELPKRDHERHLIEAQLVKTTPKQEKVVTKVIAPKEPPKAVLPAPEKVLPQPETEVLEELPLPYVPLETPVTAPSEEVEVGSSEIEPDDHVEKIITSPSEAMQDDNAEYIFPEESSSIPYQYVETKFDIYANQDLAKAGEATIVYDATQGQKYSLKWEVEATGLLSLFYPDLVQTSHGRVSEEGLRPDLYQYQFGDKEDKSYSAEFNWSDGLVSLKSSKGEKSEHLSKNTQDLLSFMYQFMFVPPLENMQINMTNGKKVASYEYTFVGEEQLDLAFANVKTYHIQHTKLDSDDKTELWLAVDYRFVPVKISKTEKNGTVITQIATSIKMQDQLED